MDQTLSGSTVEQLDSLQLDLGRRAGSVCLLQRSTERRPLRAVPYGGGARFTHVLFRGSDIGHENLVDRYAMAARRSGAEPGV